jgi:hypothetical protein
MHVALGRYNFGLHSANSMTAELPSSKARFCRLWYFYGGNSTVDKLGLAAPGHR